MTFAAYFEGLTSASNHLRKGKGHPIPNKYFFPSSPSLITAFYLSFSTSAFKRAHKEAKMSLREAEDHSTIFSGGPRVVEKTI